MNEMKPQFSRYFGICDSENIDKHDNKNLI